MILNWEQLTEQQWKTFEDYDYEFLYDDPSQINTLKVIPVSAKIKTSQNIQFGVVSEENIADYDIEYSVFSGHGNITSSGIFRSEKPTTAIIKIQVSKDQKINEYYSTILVQSRSNIFSPVHRQKFFAETKHKNNPEDQKISVFYKTQSIVKDYNFIIKL